jgi:hypothetical protein
MGIKIDLPIHTLEEANVLAATLDNAIQQHLAYADMREAAYEEVANNRNRAEILRELRNRMTGEDQAT